MSAKAMGRVWDLDLPHNELLVLLAMADHADHAGNNIYPSIGLIAWKTGYSKRQVQRVIQKLVEDGILILVAESTAQRPNVYRMNLEAGKIKQPFKGELTNAESRQNDTPDILSPVTQLRHGRGDILTERGDIAMSPEPSEGTVNNRERDKPPAPAHPAIELYTKLTGTQPAKFAADMIAEQVTDLNRWGKVIKDWLASGFKPGNVKGMLDWYHGKGRHQDSNTNGQRPPADLPLVTAAPRQTPEERRAAAERFKVILEESRSAGK